jgi:hypothetical protein
MALQPYSAQDPFAVNDYNAALIDPAFTANLLNLGYNPTPFATREQTWQNQLAFINRLKTILDQQMGTFDPYMQDVPESNRPAALPGILQRYFGMANSAFMDPLYSPGGAAGFFGGGWKPGQLPQNVQPGYQYWKDSINHPNVPAPLGAGGSSGGSGGSPGGGTQQYTVGLQGGGSMTVNANSPDAARQNAEQGGNHPTDRVERGGYQF